jgi:hypothetical protein
MRSGDTYACTGERGELKTELQRLRISAINWNRG